MKRFILILAVIPLIFSSCSRDPFADFSATRVTADVGEIIYFTNLSVDARNYEWDFGDGSYSTSFNVSHIWDLPGNYTVTLRAFGKNGKLDVATMGITILNPVADLEITVLEYYDEYVVPGASVRLYPSVTDWENETNMVVEGFTNNNGVVTFLDLPANRRYYVDVWEEFHDNYTLAEEDVKWIETQILAPNTFNTFVAYVDYYAEGKKAAISTKELKKMRAVLDPSKEIRIRTSK